jgi:hypothetical protein
MHTFLRSHIPSARHIFLLLSIYNATVLPTLGTLVILSYRQVSSPCCTTAATTTSFELPRRSACLFLSNLTLTLPFSSLEPATRSSICPKSASHHAHIHTYPHIMFYIMYLTGMYKLSIQIRALAVHGSSQLVSLAWDKYAIMYRNVKQDCSAQHYLFRSSVLEGRNLSAP